MLQWEHSAILSTFIKLPFVIKVSVLSIFEWRLKRFYCTYCYFQVLRLSGPSKSRQLDRLHFQTLDLIQLFCDQQNFKYLRLDGQTPVGKRQELVQRFNDKHIHDCKCMKCCFFIIKMNNIKTLVLAKGPLTLFFQMLPKSSLCKRYSLYPLE